MELFDEDVNTCYPSNQSRLSVFVNVTLDTLVVDQDMEEGVAINVVFKEEIHCGNIKVRSFSINITIQRKLKSLQWPIVTHNVLYNKILYAKYN